MVLLESRGDEHECGASLVAGHSGFVSGLEVLAAKVPSLDAYPFSIPALRALQQKLWLHPAVTFVVGENGSGKSTIVEALAVAAGFNAEGGSRNFNFTTRPTESALRQCFRITRPPKRPSTGFFLRAESYFNVATNIEELDAAAGPGPPIIDSYGGTSLHEQSHGESFLALLTHRFGPHGLYILDEPEAALSPRRLLVLLSRMGELIDQGSQFVIATHSPILMAFPNALIYVLSDRGIQGTAYEDTDHFQLTKSFLDDPKTFLELLLTKGRSTPR